MHLGAKQPEMQQKRLKTGVGTVDQTVPAPVFAFWQQRKRNTFDYLFVK